MNSARLIVWGEAMIRFNDSNAAVFIRFSRALSHFFCSAALMLLVLSSRGALAGGDIGVKLKHFETGGAWVYSVEAEFDDVKDSLVEAIESRGMVMSYISHAKAMLSRTAVTIGGAAVYSDAEVLLFCKANLAHKLVAANPHNLILCPYAIAVYGLLEEPARIYVSIRHPEPDVAEYKAIHQLLQNVIAEALAEQ